MESWMLIAGLGAVLGLGAIVGMVWGWRKQRGKRRWIAVAGFAALGLLGAVLSGNATAFAGGTEPTTAEADFDAPLDDDF